MSECVRVCVLTDGRWRKWSSMGVQFVFFVCMGVPFGSVKSWIYD